MSQPTSAQHRDELLWLLTGLLLGLALFLVTDHVAAGAVVGVTSGLTLYTVARIRRGRDQAIPRRTGRFDLKSS